MNLDIEQASREINHDGAAIATALRGQADAGDPAAQAIIMNYSNMVTDPNAVARLQFERDFLVLYNDWRTRYDSIVAATAQAVGNPPPGAAATATAAPPVPSIFAAPQTAPAGTQTAQEPPPQAPQATAPTSAEAPPQQSAVMDGKARNVRRAWSATQLVKLTQFLHGQPPELHGQLIARFVSEIAPNMDAATVTAKAIEVGLTPAPPAPRVIELSDSDKAMLTK